MALQGYAGVAEAKRPAQGPKCGGERAGRDARGGDGPHGGRAKGGPSASPAKPGPGVKTTRTP